MTATTQDRNSSDVRGTEPVVVVSGDTHIGPRMNEDLRPYCPKEHLEAFDAFSKNRHALVGQGQQMMFGDTTPTGSTDAPPPDMADDPMMRQLARNAQTEGHYDMHARLRDYDRDGVAAAFLLHGSQNGEPIPFRTSPFESMNTGDDPAMSAVGYHIYNQWLADQCTIEPERHVGMAYLPLWDIDASVKELEWAAGVGLKAVNLPGPMKDIPEYSRPEWEPFWSAAEHHNMALVSHGGQETSWQYYGPAGTILQMMEGGGWMARRHLHWLAYSGVLYRHPSLKVVITEISGDWFPALVQEVDGPWGTASGAEMRRQVPELPSEGLKRCVFGAWWLCPHETQPAVAAGLEDNLIWGSDYPHLEGTWQYPDENETVPRSQLHQRYGLGGLDDDVILKMAGENAVRAYNLDMDALKKVAARINAPKLEDLRKPLLESEIRRREPRAQLPLPEELVLVVDRRDS